MGCRIHGMTVVLYERHMTDTDPFGRPVYEEEAVPVENVLVGEPTSQEIVDTLNLTGKRIAYTLGIPKGDMHVWTDRNIGFFGEMFHAVGAPVQGMEDLLPLDWNKKLHVERIS